MPAAKALGEASRLLQGCPQFGCVLNEVVLAPQYRAPLALRVREVANILPGLHYSPGLLAVALGM